MVGGTGIEPVTPSVSGKCSTAELTTRFPAIFPFFTFVTCRSRNKNTLHFASLDSKENLFGKQFREYA